MKKAVKTLLWVIGIPIGLIAIIMASLGIALLVNHMQESNLARKAKNTIAQRPIAQRPASDSQNTVSTSKVWYSGLLKEYFSKGLPFHGLTHPLDVLPCLSSDIVAFDVSAGITDIGLGQAFQIKGSVKLAGISEPFSVLNGVKGKKYMLFLEGYLVSPKGQIIWQQQGFPAGDAWTSASGDKKDFLLIDSFNGSTKGAVLILIAAGNPIISDYDLPIAILGVKKIAFN
jgi:hypothetical protein